VLLLTEGDGLRCVAMHEVPPAFQSWLHKSFVPDPGSGLAAVVRSKRLVRVEDIRATPAYS
jgi:hypothetical protein